MTDQNRADQRLDIPPARDKVSFDPGAIVKWDHATMAWLNLGFKSPWLHSSLSSPVDVLQASTSLQIHVRTILVFGLSASATVGMNSFIDPPAPVPRRQDLSP